MIKCWWSLELGLSMYAGWDRVGRGQEQRQIKANPHGCHFSRKTTVKDREQIEINTGI